MIRMNRSACLSLVLLLQKLFVGTAFFLQPQRRGPSLALLVAESDDVVVATQENVYSGLSAGKSHQHDNAHGKGQVTNEHPKQSKPWKQLLTRSMTSSLLATSLVLAPFQLEAETPPKHLSTSFLQQQQQHPGLPRLSLNSAWALTEQQLLVDDVWREVTRQFVDRTFQNLGEDGWRQKRLDAVTKAGKLTPDDTDQLYGIIRQMLSYLGDPYTRFLTPEQYESLTNYAKGTNSQAGIGVQLSADPTTGRVIVMNTVPGGPAEKAGILPGDVIYEVDSVDMQGATPEVVGAKCRGEPGSALTMTFQHGGDGKPDGKLLKVDLTRAFVQSRQVQASVVTTDSGKRIGLVQIPSFSFETEKQVREAIDSLANKKVSAVALDLRGNAGGYLFGGIDVAKLFLAPPTRIISEVDKTGRATIYVSDGVGTTDTTTPIYLLVDQKTASASEIFAAAMQDNQRATVVGSTATFGKGRIQNVQELSMGCGIAVTKAKYMTPKGNDIQGVGIKPDVITDACGSNDSAQSCLNVIL